MKKRIFAGLALFSFLANISVLAVVPTRIEPASPSSELVNMLPASDAVVSIDAKRFFGVALPRVLARNQPMLAQITAKIDEMKNAVGVDLRQFETVVAGVRAIPVKKGEYDFEPVVIARGQVSAQGIVGALKIGANGKLREEKVGDRQLYRLSVKDLVEDVTKNIPAATAGKTGKVVGKISQEAAISALDSTTIAIGTVGMVRELMAGKSKIGTDVTGLLLKENPGIVNFAAKMPAGLKGLLPLDNEEVGKNVESIRYLFGGIDMLNDAAVLNVTARTTDNALANSLLETLLGLKMIGKAFVSEAKSEDLKAVSRVLENTKLAAVGTDVRLDVSIVQTDIDMLVSKLK